MRLPHSDTHRPWPLYVLAAPATVAVWSGWVGLGEMTGFGMVHPLPGIADNFSLNTAITLPIGVECYAAYALGAWLSSRPLSKATRGFAKWSALGALLLGGGGQIAYHLLEVGAAAGTKISAPMWITTIVACIPVVVLGLGATLAHLIHRDGDTEPNSVQVTDSVTQGADQVTPEPVTYASDLEASRGAGQVTPKSLTQVTFPAVTQATEQVTAEVTPAGLTRATPEPVTSTALQVTPKTPAKSPAKSPSKAAGKSRRSDDELIAELNKIVAEHYRNHPGEEIKVQPVARQLGIGRDRARTLLDQMSVRPIRREATG